MSYHQPRKRFGQNFLRDPHVIERIVGAIAPHAEDTLVEIGPGQGALTLALLARTGKLIAVELDRDLIAPLQARCTGMGELILHTADALQFNFAALDAGKGIRIVGNLPYNISTPLIFHLLQQAQHIQDMHFMLQKEVVLRLAAAPGTAAYGRLSVMVQYACSVEALFIVPPTAFYPAPKVESAIVRLTPHAVLPVKARDPQLFSDLVRQAFMHRRKTIANNLRGWLPAGYVLPIDGRLRAEALSVTDYVQLANDIANQD